MDEVFNIVFETLTKNVTILTCHASVLQENLEVVKKRHPNLIEKVVVDSDYYETHCFGGGFNGLVAKTRIVSEVKDQHRKMVEAIKNEKVVAH